MGLESSTYISGLTNTWPTSNDPKSQGDDHLRLLKGVLQATFPNASRPFYIPSTRAVSTTQSILPADQNALLVATTTSGDIQLTLPSLTVSDTGFWVDVIKISNDGNGVKVVPTSGNISSGAGAVASIRVGVLVSPARLLWDGSTWYCVKHGAMVGSTINFDGAGTPPGHLVLDGSTFSSATFAELSSVLGTTTLRDKRGRVEAGVDSGGLRLTGAGLGATANVGAAGGSETYTLTTAQMPSHFHSAGISDPTHTHPFSYSGPTLGAGTGSTPNYFYSNITSLGGTTSAAATGVRVNSSNGLDTTYSAGGGSAHVNVQPTIVVQKLIRAC